MSNYTISLTFTNDTLDITTKKDDSVFSKMSIKYESKTIERNSYNNSIDHNNFFETVHLHTNFVPNTDDIVIQKFVKISKDSKTFTLEQLEQFPQMWNCNLEIDINDVNVIVGDLSIAMITTKCKHPNSNEQLSLSKSLISNEVHFSNIELVVQTGGKLQANTINLDNVHLSNNGVILCSNEFKSKGSKIDNEKDGFIDANSMNLDSTQHTNNGDLITKKFRVTKGPSFVNHGTWFHEGDVIDLQGILINNHGNIEWKNTQINMLSSLCPYNNSGSWIMDGVSLENEKESLNMTNSKILQLKNCTLKFNNLTNCGNVVINSGNYTICGLNNAGSLSQSPLISLLDNDWLITDDVNHTKKRDNYLLLTANKVIGNIEVEKSLTYSLDKMPASLNIGKDITICGKPNVVRTLSDLNCIKCTGTVFLTCQGLTCDKPISFPNINYLYLTIQGDFTNRSTFNVCSGSLRPKGSIINLGSIQSTVGKLEIVTENGNIDNTKGKIYSKGDLTLNSGKDLLNGEAKAGGNFSYTFNDSYIASCGNSWLSAKGTFNNTHGQIFSHSPMKISGDIILNIAGDIACGNDITFSGKTLTNSRNAVITVNVGDWTWAYSGCYDHRESSDQAIIRALGNIYFKVDQGSNIASSILAQKEIMFQHGTTEKSNSRLFGNLWNIFSNRNMKTDMPSTFTSSERTLWGYGCNDKVGYQRSCSPRSTYPATIQSGQKISVETDHFSMSGSMSSPVIKIQGKSADFNNQVRHRNNVLQTTMYIDLTKFIQERVTQTAGLLTNENGNIQCDVSLGDFSPKDLQVLLIDNDTLAFSKRSSQLPSPFNPLKNLPSDFMELFIQSALSIYAGKLYLNGKGNSITEKLLSNSDLFQQETHKITMKKGSDDPQYAMLLGELQQVNNVIQKNTILYLPANEINPHQSSGDIAANEFTCNTTENQTHANNRIVARDVLCVMAKNVTRRTESYITVNYVNDSKVTEDISMPKQTFICLNGDVTIKASESIHETGTTTIGNNIKKESDNIVENPLILNKTVETKHESGSIFNRKESTEVETSHAMVPNENIARNDITKHAQTTIDQKSTSDVAGKTAEFSAKSTNISGMIINDIFESTSSKSNGFTDQTTRMHKESPTIHNASVSAPTTIFKGESATLSGCDVTGKTIEDHTKDALKFQPTIGEVKYVVQQTVDSPLSGVDAGCEGGSTVLGQCRIDVENIVRKIDDEKFIVFDTVIWAKQKPLIIGKATEITTEIRQWHTTWCKTHQTIPDGAIVIASLAISFATYGTGATLVGVGGTWGTMSSAAFTTLCNAAATSFLKSGDPILSAKSLLTNDFYRSLAINVASAGIIDAAGLNVKLDANSSTILDYAKFSALRSLVNVPLTCVIGRRPINEGLVNEAANIATDTISGYSAGKIGLMYRNGDLSFMNHKFFHGIAGAVSGGVTNAILNKDMIEGALSGAIGATISEMAGEMIDSKSLDLKSIDQRLFTSKVIAGTVALLMKQDVNLAVKIAGITVENNLWPCLAYLNAVLVALGVTHAAKDAMDVYEETENVNDAIDTFMLHGVIMSAVNGVVRLGGRVFGMCKNAWKVSKTGVGSGIEIAGGSANMTASSALNKDLLHHQLSLQEKMGEAGTILDSIAKGNVFKNEPRIVATYGGKIGEWTKKTSSNFTTNAGQKIEVHWVENLRTGQRVEFKQKLLNLPTSQVNVPTGMQEIPPVIPKMAGEYIYQKTKN